MISAAFLALGFCLDFPAELLSDIPESVFDEAETLIQPIILLVVDLVDEARGCSRGR